MFSQDEEQEEVTGTPSHQAASPMNIKFEIFCVFDPLKPGMPKCRVKYKPMNGEDSDQVDSEIEESNEDLEDSTDDENGRKAKKKSRQKKHRVRKDEDDRYSDSDYEDDSDQNNPLIRCVSEVFDSCDEDE
jgi:hypothetical protein